MKSVLATLCLATGLLLSAPSPALAQTHPDDQRQIEAIVETFRTAIIDKDVERFMTLFLHEDITWTGTTSRATIARIAAAEKDSKRPLPKKYFNGKPRKFIEGIAKDKEALAETFENVRIDSDGEVAQVWFDYSFMVGSFRQNWGKESWQMVRTDSGWKIAAVVWSMTFEPDPPPGEKKD